MAGRLRETSTVVIALALVVTALWYALRPTEPPPAYAGPSRLELDSLARYLGPVPPAPPLDDYDMFVPAGEPLPAPRAAPPAPVVRTTYRLSAILVVGDRPMAIIDDQQVRTGSTLPGGTQVVEIDRSQVVLRDPDGFRRTLRLTPTGRMESNDL